MTLLVVGLDGFQQINNMLGHASGDLVLRAVSERLTARFGHAGIVARLSGDEFAIAIPDAAISSENVSKLRRADRRQPSTRRCWPETASIASRSISAPRSSPCDGRTAEELLSNSHLAFWPRQGHQARRSRAVRGRHPAANLKRG